MSSLYYISKSITNQAFLNYLYLHNASSDRLKHLIKNTLINKLTRINKDYSSIQFS